MYRLPLAAVRVIELEADLAGARCARLLGDLGAEVIKVEPPSPPREAGDPLRFDLDRNKLGCTLDIASARGLALLRRLVRRGRVTITTPDQAGQPSVGELREAKADLIVVSLPTAAASEPPSLEDVTLGTAAAAAVLIALLRHRRTGEGGLIEVNWGGISASFRGESTLKSERMRQSKSDAPCGCLRCSGGRSITISVRSDVEFAALCGIIGRPELKADPRFADAASRIQNEADLRPNVEEWTAARSPEEAAQALQEAGVIAAPVLSPADLAHDPHLRQRAFFELVSHAIEGEREIAGVPWRFSHTPAHARLPAPRPGGHNAYVFGRLLGLSEEEMVDLSKQGVIGEV